MSGHFTFLAMMISIQSPYLTISFFRFGNTPSAIVHPPLLTVSALRYQVWCAGTSASFGTSHTSCALRHRCTSFVRRPLCQQLNTRIRQARAARFVTIAPLQKEVTALPNFRPAVAVVLWSTAARTASGLTGRLTTSNAVSKENVRLRSTDLKTWTYRLF